jgi:hypothetical protein
VIVKTCIRPATMPIAEAFKCGHEQGLGQGWTLGHRAARPVVVQIPIREQPAPADSATYLNGHTASLS